VPGGTASVVRFCGGVRGGPPSGVVTFLFTDIEGSTRRWEAAADEMQAALLAHDEVLYRAIEAQGGYVFSHTGDGVVAAFASPRSAVDAAVAAQRELELPVLLHLSVCPACGACVPPNREPIGPVQRCLRAALGAAAEAAAIPPRKTKMAFRLGPRPQVPPRPRSAGVHERPQGLRRP
jgi:class 3 adenylate cyclase